MLEEALRKRNVLEMQDEERLMFLLYAPDPIRAFSTRRLREVGRSDRVVDRVSGVLGKAQEAGNAEGLVDKAALKNQRGQLRVEP